MTIVIDSSNSVTCSKKCVYYRDFHALGCCEHVAQSLAACPYVYYSDFLYGGQFKTHISVNCIKPIYITETSLTVGNCQHICLSVLSRPCMYYGEFCHGRLRLKCDGTRAETPDFVLWRNKIGRASCRERV